MARGERDLRVNFLANVRDFLRGTRDAGRALEDLEQDFKDTDRASDNANRSMQDAARKTARTLDTTAKDAGGRFKNAGSEIGAEFSQNFGEAIRSGNPMQALAETATSLGPALGLAGLAAAAGTGIVMGIVSRIKEQQERLRQAGRDMFRALQDGILEQSEKEDLLTQAFGVEDFADALGRARDIAADLGVPIGQVVEYLTTGGEVVAPQLAAAMETANTKAAAMARIVGKGTLPALDASVQATKDLEAATGFTNTALATGAGLVAAQKESLEDSAYWIKVMGERAAVYVDKMSKLYASDPNNPAFTGRYPSARG